MTHVREIGIHFCVAAAMAVVAVLCASQPASTGMEQESISQRDQAVEQTVVEDGWSIRCRRTSGGMQFVDVTRFNLPPPHAIPRLRGLEHLDSVHVHSRISDDDLRGIGELKGLRSLRLYGRRGITDAGLAEIAELKNLEDLALVEVSAKGLTFLQPLRKLRSLDLTGVSVGDDDLWPLADLSELRFLRLVSSGRVGAPGLKTIAELPSLASLWLADGKIEPEDLRNLRHMTRLRALTLSRIDVTGEGLRELQGLEALTLGQLSITREGMRAIADLRDLRVLTILDADLPPEALETLARCPSLGELYLSLEPLARCAPLEAARPDLEPFSPYRWQKELYREEPVPEIPTFSPLGRLAKLRCLVVNGTRGLKGIDAAKSLELLSVQHSEVRSADLEALGSIAGLKSLELDVQLGESLDLSGLGGLPELKRIRITWGLRDEDLTRLVQTAPGLEVVDLSVANVTDAGLGELPKLEKLRVLTLVDAKQITDNGLKNLSQISSLEELDLSGTNVTDAGLKHLTALPNLHTLGLRDLDSITDAGLSSLAGISSLEELDLSGTGLAEAGLRELGELPNLRVLRLRENIGITDEAIRHLIGIRSLERLDLSLTDVSYEALRQLAVLSSLKEVDLCSRRHGLRQRPPH